MQKLSYEEEIPTNPTHPYFTMMQVIKIESEKETGGFLAPSITILAREGWKSGATLEKCPKRLSKLDSQLIELRKTSQELRMLSNVTLNCQVAKIVMNSGSQLSEL